METKWEVLTAERIHAGIGCEQGKRTTAKRVFFANSSTSFIVPRYNRQIAKFFDEPCLSACVASVLCLFRPSILLLFLTVKHKV